MINYRSAGEAADELVADIARQGGEAEAVGGDVSCEADVKALFAHCSNRFGRLDGLVNNAGSCPRSAVSRISPPIPLQVPVRSTATVNQLTAGSRLKYAQSS